ncbi:MAG: hypothetical protein ACK4N6_01365 [Rhodocyclaceae bacterium]
MKILQLDTGLFPDAQTVQAALGQLAETQSVEAIDLTRRDPRGNDWDEVIKKILAADRVITT